MSETLIHYSQKPISKLRSIAQKEHAMKPTGLWVSVAGEYGWKEWCIDNEYKGEFTHETEVVLSEDAKILRLSSPDDLKRFTEAYQANIPLNDKIFRSIAYINWQRIAELYDGIIISPYIWECRLDSYTFWYYGWDCASGCIWNAKAINKLNYKK